MSLVKKGTIDISKNHVTYMTLGVKEKVGINGYMAGKDKELVDMVEIKGKRKILGIKNDKNEHMLISSVLTKEQVNQILFIPTKTPTQDGKSMSQQLQMKRGN